MLRSEERMFLQNISDINKFSKFDVTVDININIPGLAFGRSECV